MKTVLEAQDGLTLAAALPRLMKKEADESEQMGEQAMLTYSSQRFGARGRHPPQRGGGRQVAASRSAAATVGGQGAYGALPGHVPVLPIQHNSGPRKQQWERYGRAEVQ